MDQDKVVVDEVIRCLEQKYANELVALKTLLSLPGLIPAISTTGEEME